MVFAQDGVTMHQWDFQFRKHGLCRFRDSYTCEMLLLIVPVFPFFQTIMLQQVELLVPLPAPHIDTGLSAFYCAADFSTGIWDMWAY